MHYAGSPYDYRNQQHKEGFFVCPRMLPRDAVTLHLFRLHQYHQRQINSFLRDENISGIYNDSVY